MTMQEDLNYTERRSAILELLAREGRVFVSELAQRFGITEVTVRSDLMELESRGQLERIRGGALPVRGGYYNMSLSERSQERAEEKRRIARAAVTHLRDGETLFINSGTTTLFVAQELSALSNLKVVTNSIPVAQTLSQNSGHTVILLGGDLNARYLFTYGSDALSQLRRYKADRLILSVDGVAPDCGLSTYHFEEADLDRLMMERANGVIVVADDSKLGRESFVGIAPMDGVDELITSACASDPIVKQIEAMGVRVHPA